MKNASEVAKITKESLEKKAREFIMNKAGSKIIEAARNGKDSVYVELLKDFEYEESILVAKELIKILENELDYLAKHHHYSNYQGVDSYLEIMWGHAIKL